jgi:hypothetical protein
MMENRNQHKEDAILGGLVVVLSLILIGYSFFIPSPGRWMVAPGAVPIGLSGIMGGLGLALIVQARRKGARMTGQPLHPVEALSALVRKPDFQRALGAIFFVLAFIYSINFLQFYPASLLFVLAGLRIYSPQIKWYQRLLVAVGTVAGLFVIFSWIFKLPLRLGVFEYLLQLLIGRRYL